MAKKTMTYADSLAEVERILDRIQREEVPIDSLSAEVKRATELIADCKARLRKTEEEIAAILENEK